MRTRRRECLNPRCLEQIASGRLCPSCALVGRVAFTVGSVLAGALAWWIK